jgi:micrococcal nuclease
VRRLLIALIVVAAAALAGRGVLAGDDTPTGTEHDAGEVRVLRIVDGDTIVVRLDGRRERVRYIGIDTPESVPEVGPPECYGEAAAAQNARLVEGRTVRLSTDAEKRDRFGRLLAYVRRASDGLFVNAELVRSGFATTLRIAPNVRHAGMFADLQRKARNARRGVWGACG